MNPRTSKTHSTTPVHATQASPRPLTLRVKQIPRLPPRFAIFTGSLATAALLAVSLGCNGSDWGNSRTESGADSVADSGADTKSDAADATVATNEQPEAARHERIHAQEQVKQAERAIADYEYAQREELVEDVEERLAAMEKEFEEMENSLASSSAELRRSTEAKIAELRTRWRASKKELDAAQASNEEDWQGAKERLAASYSNLENSAKSARQGKNDGLER